jgi:hypothetical protein
VLQSYDYEENEYDQHDDAPKRERSDLAPHGPDLPAARPDAQPGLIGAGGMPDQKPGGDRDENGQERKPIWGGLDRMASSTPRHAAACQLMLRRVNRPERPDRGVPQAGGQ